MESVTNVLPQLAHVILVSIVAVKRDMLVASCFQSQREAILLVVQNSKDWIWQ